MPISATAPSAVDKPTTNSVGVGATTGLSRSTNAIDEFDDVCGCGDCCDELVLVFGLVAVADEDDADIDIDVDSLEVVDVLELDADSGIFVLEFVDTSTSRAMPQATTQATPQATR